jgi:hypothetical protein
MGNLYGHVDNVKDIPFLKKAEWKDNVLSDLFQKQVVLTTKSSQTQYKTADPHYEI